MERGHLCHERIVCDSLASVLRPSRLRHSDRVEEGDWIVSRLAPFASGVSAIVPTGFEAYIRVLHPVPVVKAGPGGTQRYLTWAEVAARTGRTVHPLVQFVSIAGTRRSPLREVAGAEEPHEGQLEPHVLKPLCDVLAGQTSTPERCWFALWEGYGWMQGSPAIAELVLVRPHKDGTRPPTAPGDPGYVPPAFPPEVIAGPRFRIPQRDYFLFEGPVAAAPELGWNSPGGYFHPQSPNIFWPHDRAWCVATEIDLDSTYIGGSEALAQALLAEPQLEAWRVQPSDGIGHASDTVNPYEGSRYDESYSRSHGPPPALLRRLTRAFGPRRPKHT